MCKKTILGICSVVEWDKVQNMIDIVLILLNVVSWAVIGAWITPQLFEEKGLNKMAGRGAGIAAGALGSLILLLILWAVIATFPEAGSVPEKPKPKVNADGDSEGDSEGETPDEPALPPVNRIANLKETTSRYVDRLVPFGPAVERLVFLLAGLVLGIILASWVLPFRFANNAEPVQLEESYRQQWVKGAAAEYELTDDEDEVARKLIAAGYDADDVHALAQDNESARVGTWLDNIEGIASANTDNAQDKESEYPGPTVWSEIVMPLVGILSVAGIGVLLAMFLTTIPNPISKRFS